MNKCSIPWIASIHLEVLIYTLGFMSTIPLKLRYFSSVHLKSWSSSAAKLPDHGHSSQAITNSEIRFYRGQFQFTQSKQRATLICTFISLRLSNPHTPRTIHQTDSWLRAQSHKLRASHIVKNVILGPNIHFRTPTTRTKKPTNSTPSPSVFYNIIKREPSKSKMDEEYQTKKRKKR